MKPVFPLAARRRSRAVALAIVSPALLAFSGCGRNCDNTHSTLTTTDDCGTGTRGGYVGGVGNRGGSSISPGVGGSERGGFGRSGGWFSGGS